MHVTRQPVKGENGVGACNYCYRGDLHESGFGLVYPYEAVTVVAEHEEANGTRFCDDCLAELKMKLDGKDLKL